MAEGSGHSRASALSRRALLRYATAVGPCALLLSACAVIRPESVPPPTASAVGATTVPRSGGTLRLTIPGDIVPRNAPFPLTPANGHLFSLIYDTLVAYDT